LNKHLKYLKTIVVSSFHGSCIIPIRKIAPLLDAMWYKMVPKLM